MGNACINMKVQQKVLLQRIEAILFAANQPLSIDALQALFETDERPTKKMLISILQSLQKDCNSRGVELVEVATGYRFQTKMEHAPWVARLWDEKPSRYSRALLETLALIAYRQPITRAEIEDIRGVSVSSHIVKTLLERDWVRVVGTKEVPGRPSLYATTRQFLDYFGLSGLQELPTLMEMRSFDALLQEQAHEASSEADVQDSN